MIKKMKNIRFWVCLPWFILNIPLVIFIESLSLIGSFLGFASEKIGVAVSILDRFFLKVMFVKNVKKWMDHGD
jgi:hypothetical protein